MRKSYFELICLIDDVISSSSSYHMMRGSWRAFRTENELDNDLIKDDVDEGDEKAVKIN